MSDKKEQKLKVEAKQLWEKERPNRFGTIDTLEFTSENKNAILLELKQIEKEIATDQGYCDFYPSGCEKGKFMLYINFQIDDYRKLVDKFENSFGEKYERQHNPKDDPDCVIQ